MEVEGWLHLFVSLLIHHGPANRRVWILITLIRLDQLVFVVELMLSIRDWRQSLLDKHFELLNVEQVWYEIIMPAQLKERPGDHGKVLLLDILPTNRFLYIVKVLMQPVNE